MAETLSDKVDKILAEYDNIIARSNQTSQRYTEEALFTEILTNDKREILEQIIDSILAQENAQMLLRSYHDF